MSKNYWMEEMKNTNMIRANGSEIHVPEKCDHCGRFIAEKDLPHCLEHVPDTEFGPEENYFICLACFGAPYEIL